MSIPSRTGTRHRATGRLRSGPCRPRRRRKRAAKGSILVVGGKGPLDDIAAAMLAQLLGKHDLGTRIAPFGDVARDRIATLDVSGVLIIAVTYLDLGGNPSHLRALLKRLRDRMPGVPIVVGQTVVEAAADRPDADHVVATLRDGVIACRDIAEAAGASDRELLTALG